MATTNDASKSEVEKTPIEQNVNGQTEGADGADGEEGAVQPDNIFQVTIKLPHEPFEMPMTVRVAMQNTWQLLMLVDFIGRAGARPPPVHHRDAAHIPVLVFPPGA
ncbi:hypothetical protein PtrSN002B_004473 [Pyrenophora tritici-repentis]|uniref:Uncharacterized protein n=1 Tax=Pyrenophora tritici-repentis TaxID=45151 RepID=A0A317BHT4_9PLEO|nr:hypothetical protein PtrV1_00430 [Pyrenophora tritici-repentis]KAF7453145.1 Clustered mitochondria protein [Pyrenophora tritici-repentis]KAF7576206.1 hypothetical protein PtrM4_004460 [Pyrenophora tritici-repentis]KAG9377396.1 Clustered mitochondria protein [Pyrenophora tritici-repentis]KAI1539918.1 hypothetical protein PtrSN001A_004377 [Pyrenophora tritici-repentis]